MSTEYRPIFFEPSWIVYRRHGWRPKLFDDGLCVAEKRYGPFKRTLILVRDEGLLESNARLHQLNIFLPNAAVIVQNFAGTDSPDLLLCGRRLKRMDEGERLLNSATYVIDLAEDDATLLRRMTSEYPRKIRKAERLGVKVGVTRRAREPDFADFVARYQAHARSRGLRGAEGKVWAEAIDGGDALLFCAKRDGEPKNYALIYMAGKSAYFLHGAGIDTKVEGVGQYLHWEIMRHLRSAGYRWYDLGGIAPDEGAVGLNKFKKAFGGAHVGLGDQYIWRSPVLELVHHARKLVGELRGPGKAVHARAAGEGAANT